MTSSLLISVRLHDGRYHGAGDWPPSPARLFQALIAGAARGETLRNEERTALLWLEKLTPPEIAAPPPHRTKGFVNYVPDNALDAVNGDVRRIGEIRTTKPIKSVLFDAELPILYVWRFDPSKEDTRLAHIICTMAEDIYQLGRGVDMAWAWGEVVGDEIAGARLASHSGRRHFRTEHGNGVSIDCPMPGSLESLEKRFRAQGQRFIVKIENKHKIRVTFSQAPKARFTQFLYNSPATFPLYDIEGPLAPWSAVECVELVERVRDAASERLAKALPDKKNEIERVVIGRGVTEADKGTRVRILPLPSIGHPHADHAIRRVLVEIPPNCPIRAEDVAWAFSGLPPTIDHETGEILLELVPATDRGMLHHYGADGDRAYRVWRTVSPSALPERAARRRIDPRRLHEQAKDGRERAQEEHLAAAAVFQALRHAQIGAHVSTVRVQREPFEAKGTRAESFATGTRFAKERLWHIEIGFAQPVAGPLVLGDGRYLGLGLMAPVAAVEGIHCFTILDGLANSADTNLVTRALRRAVMARVQHRIGMRKRLPEFFSGHEPDGAPSRREIQGHLAFAADLTRSRLLIITPHVLEGRQPKGTEHGHLRVLDESMADLTELRAGAAGRLTLTQSPIQIYEDPLFAPAREWESVTDYHPTRYRKRMTASEALASDAHTEVLRRGIPTPTQIEVIEIREGPHGGLSGRLRLRFMTAVSGPILIGRTRHAGGGLFSSSRALLPVTLRQDTEKRS